MQELPFVDALLALVDDHSALAFLFAVFVGSLGNLLAYVYVSAVVALTINGAGGATSRSSPASSTTRPSGACCWRC